MTAAAGQAALRGLGQNLTTALAPLRVDIGRRIGAQHD